MKKKSGECVVRAWEEIEEEEENERVAGREVEEITDKNVVHKGRSTRSPGRLKLCAQRKKRVRQQEKGIDITYPQDSRGPRECIYKAFLQ